MYHPESYHGILQPKIHHVSSGRSYQVKTDGLLPSNQWRHSFMISHISLAKYVKHCQTLSILHVESVGILVPCKIIGINEISIITLFHIAT